MQRVKDMTPNSRKIAQGKLNKHKRKADVQRSINDAAKMPQLQVNPSLLVSCSVVYNVTRLRQCFAQKKMDALVDMNREIVASCTTKQMEIVSAHDRHVYLKCLSLGSLNSYGKYFLQKSQLREQRQVAHAQLQSAQGLQRELPADTKQRESEVSKVCPSSHMHARTHTTQHAHTRLCVHTEGSKLTCT